MIVEFGSFALALALCLSLAQTGLSVAGRVRRDPLLQGGGEGAALGAFLCVVVAFAALTYAFVRSDFSVANVAANSHTAKPLLYKVAGVWGSHEGSMLLWNLALTGFGLSLAWGGRHLPRNLRSSAVATQGALALLFLGYTVFVSSPFVRLADPPVEGASLNPVLQDPALAFHPPFLYAGYVGFSVVFSLAVAALVEGRVDAAWARWLRPWTLAAWSLLTIGITLGSFWAYYELGWGGWWFWDPVENASFMPWLVGTALLHSAIVTERRGALVGWTVFLALAAFAFAMLGAFLVRSGVLTSVHAFAVDPTRGGILLGILGVSAGGAFALFAWRASKLRPGGAFAPVSRETALVLNNLFLSAATATVLLGTLFPLIREALTGQPISVGPPYFNLTFAPLMAITLLILPFGPLLAWKRGDLLGAFQRLWAAVGAAVLAAAAVVAFSEPRKLVPILGGGIGAWLIAGALTEAAERIRLFRAPVGESLRRLASLPRGAWGTTLAHAGLGVFVLGACFETAWKVEAAEVLHPGQAMTVGAYQLQMSAVGPAPGANYDADQAVVVARRGDRVVCTAKPERRLYTAGGQTTSEVAICMVGVSDLYLVLGERRDDAAGEGGWLLRAYWNPYARLIFLGPAIMALGGLVSVADRRLRVATPAKARVRLQPEPAE
jgi:cytochrome c-type biogenesis protein CcmF